MMHVKTVTSIKTNLRLVYGTKDDKKLMNLILAALIFIFQKERSEGGDVRYRSKTITISLLFFNTPIQNERKIFAPSASSSAMNI